MFGSSEVCPLLCFPPRGEKPPIPSAVVFGGSEGSGIRGSLFLAPLGGKVARSDGHETKWRAAERKGALGVWRRECIRNLILAM